MITLTNRCNPSRITLAGYVRLGMLLIALGGIACTQPAAKLDNQKPFTIAMLPDTQHYSRGYPDYFYAQTNWIKQHRDDENIVFVTQVGDIVNDRSSIMSQWNVAAKAMATLDGVVPWGVAIGNHDYETKMIDKGVATTWLRHFGPERFKGYKWFGGASANGLNSYQLFSAGGVEFIIFHLEVNVPDEAIAWVNDVLRQYPTRAAIVSTHIYLRGLNGFVRDPKHEYRPNGNSGEQIWDKLIRVNPQIFMVLCAHVGRTCELYQVSLNDAGNKVIEMLADYQRRDHGGDGWLRLLRFVPADREIQVRTYSPVLDRFETDPDSQFIVPWELPKTCRVADHWTSTTWRFGLSCRSNTLMISALPAMTYNLTIVTQ